MAEQHTEAEGMRERLLGLDPQDSAGRGRFEAELQAAFDRRLAAPSRIRYGALGVSGLIGCLVCGSLAATEPAATPVAVRGLLALFAFIGLGWTILAAWILSRRQGGLLESRTAAAQTAFGFTLLTVIALALVLFVLGRAQVAGPMLAAGLALLVLAGVVLTDVRIERSELAIREQLLRLESRLTDLIEASRRVDSR